MLLVTPVKTTPYLLHSSSSILFECLNFECKCTVPSANYPTMQYIAFCRLKKKKNPSCTTRHLTVMTQNDDD